MKLVMSALLEPNLSPLLANVAEGVSSDGLISPGDAQPLGHGIINYAVNDRRIEKYEVVDGRSQITMVKGSMTEREATALERSANAQQPAINNDSDVDLVYTQARYYDPGVGRFLSIDPVTPSAGNQANFNRYAYVNDNPIMRIDPDGRTTTCTNGQCVITADTYNVATSNGQTTLESPKIRAAGETGKSTVAVHNGPEEKVGFIVKGEDGKLTVQNSSDTKTGSTNTAKTASAKIPQGEVALIHGHIDSGPARTNSMVVA
ncbi:RHS repeat-associated protein [Luteibacter sp. OK325]|uniref:RHS repeat-associated core domain-containing protein n=1 Tax=Luteibacter sp. OK325 TaxID=2135670 RepID=UPI000D42AC3B|nr:RHS repeat-associated core domain-containing protein [Luteibacter sp. OK325]PTR35125.1 RHS repeat-associated protein [Luteibacter sp. OK325]